MKFIVKNNILIFIFVLFTFITSGSFVNSQTSDSLIIQDSISGLNIANPSGLVSIKPFKNDISIKNSSPNLIYGFNYDSTSYSINKATLVLNFQNSIVTLPQISYITVNLNGFILSTRFADSPQPQNSSWEIDIPMKYLKNGYNTFNFFCWLRSSTDPCMDFYNSQDWVKLFSTSGVYFNRTVKSNLEIFNYPFPFFDDLNDSPVNTSINIKDKNSTVAINAFLKLCSSLNNYISYDNNVNFSVNASGKSNNIYIGEIKDFPQLTSASSNDTSGIISLNKNSGGYDLILTGKSNDAIMKSVYALSNKNTVLEMNFNPFISNLLSNAHSPSLPVIPSNASKAKFSDIGIQDIRLPGLFESRAGIRIVKPVGFDIGFGTKLKIIYSYPGNLKKNSSMISVLVNTKFAGSRSFDLSEKSIDSIEVLIPKEELNKNSWQIEFVAYNDFDITPLECNKRFSGDIATIVEDDSEIEFVSGNYEYNPDLNSFPMILSSLNRSSSDVLFWFPTTPDDKLLNLAASISYQATRKNATYLNVKSFIGETLPDDLKNSKVIFLISNKFSNVYASLKDKMILLPVSESEFSIKSGYSIATTNLKNTSVIESLNSPFSDGIIYSIYANNFSMLNLINYINSNEISNLEQQIALINDKNSISAISKSKEFTEIKEVEGFFIKNLRYFIFGIFFATIFLFWYLNKLRKRKKSS